MPEFQDIKFIIFPDDTLRVVWDTIILTLMIYTVTITPYRVAFIEVDTAVWLEIDYTIDILFGADVILNCFMAYLNNEEVLITNRWAIIKTYMKTWMLFDVVSCIPFQLIFQSSGWGTLLRLSKLPRLYRLIKIVKLVRLIKVLKNRNKVLSCLECFSKLSVGMERLIYFTLCILVTCHLFACILYFVSRFNSDNVNNWVFKYGIDDLSLAEKYLASVYWTVTTLCTIGYGDVTPACDLERGVVIFIELAGVFFYSYTIGTITSLMADMDKKKSKLDAKIVVLQEISKKFNLPRRFYEKLKFALEYNETMLNKERNEMIMNLPKKLALQLNLVMNKSLIDKNAFLQLKPLKFITSIIDFLRPLKVKQKEVIFRKGELPEEMFLIKSGEIVFYEEYNKIQIDYFNIGEGSYFGHVDIFLNEIRETNAKAAKPSELYTLTREELFQNILAYFEDIKFEMIDEANQHKEILTKLKDEALSKYKQESHFIVASYDASEFQKDSNQYYLTDSNRKGRRKVALNTLAPTPRAMLDDIDEVSINYLRLEIEKLTKTISELEDRYLRNNVSRNEN